MYNYTTQVRNSRTRSSPFFTEACNEDKGQNETQNGVEVNFLTHFTNDSNLSVDASQILFSNHVTDFKNAINRSSALRPSSFA